MLVSVLKMFWFRLIPFSSGFHRILVNSGSVLLPITNSQCLGETESIISQEGHSPALNLCKFILLVQKKLHRLHLCPSIFSSTLRYSPSYWADIDSNCWLRFADTVGPELVAMR